MTSQREEKPALPGGPGWGGAGGVLLRLVQSRGDAGDSGTGWGGPPLNPHPLPSRTPGEGATAEPRAQPSPPPPPPPALLRRGSGSGRRCQRHACSPPCWSADPQTGQSPSLPPREFFLPLGEMSPCNCGASRSDVPLSGSRLGFVRCINPTGLAVFRINPESSRAAPVPSPGSQSRCCRLKEKHHSDWETGSLRWKAGGRAAGRVASHQG